MAVDLKNAIKENLPVAGQPSTGISLKDAIKQDLDSREQATDVQLGQYGVGESKYDIGVTPENVGQLGEIRAQRQSSAAKLGAGLVNAVVTTGLDVIKDTSYLLDAENYFNFEKSSQEGFQNWLGSSMQSLEDKLKIPVYRTKESEGFSPFSAGFWGENMPSIMSTIAMAFPAELATKGLSGLGKLVKGNDLIKGIEAATGFNELGNTIKGVSSAVISRQMESLMEGGQTYNDTFNKAIQSGKSEEEAKIIAGEAAAQNYKLNWAALAQDLPEYLMLHKSFKEASGAFSINGAKEALKIAGIEGSEEAYQYITDKESQREALINGNVLKSDNTSFGDRMLQYSKDGDLWTSAFLGAIGGAGFGLYGVHNNKKNQQQFDGLLEMHKGVLKNDPETYNRGVDNTLNISITDNIANGNLENFRNGLQTILSSPERIKDEDREEVLKRTKTALDQTYYAEKLGKTIIYDNSLTPELKKASFIGQLNQKSAENRLQEINSKLNILQTKDYTSLNDSNPTLHAYKQAKLTLEGINNIKNLTNEVTQLQSIVEERGKELLNTYPDKYKSLEDLNKDIISSNDEEMKQLLTNKVIENSILKEAKNIVYKTKTEEGKKELQKQIDNSDDFSDFEEMSNIVDENGETINNFSDYIENASSSKELDKIIDQADKAGETTPELLDEINKKREELNDEILNIESDQFGLEPDLSNEDLDFLGQSEDDQLAILESQNSGEEIDQPIIEDEVTPVKTVLTEGKSITDSRSEKIMSKIKKFINKHEDINDHITLKSVKEGDYNNVWILLDGKHIANLSGNEIKESNNQLNNNIRNIVNSSDKIYTPKELGIYFGITDGSLDLVPKGKELTPVSDLKLNLNLTGGQTLIYDFNTRKDGKYTRGSWIGTIDNSLFKPGITIERNAIPKNLGRYILVAPMENGSIKYIRVRPAKLDSLTNESTNKIYGELLEKSKQVKSSLTSVDRDKLDEFNSELNSRFFIALNNSIQKPLRFNGKQYDSYQVNIEVEPQKGNIRTTIEGRLREEYEKLDVIFINPVSNNGSLDAFLENLNKQLKGLTITRNDFKSSITEKNYITDMVASVTPNIVKSQSLIFRKLSTEDTNAKNTIVEDTKIEESTDTNSVGFMGADIESINNLKFDIERRREEELNNLIPKSKKSSHNLDFSAAFSGWIGKGLYDAIFQALKNNKNTVSGVKEPLLDEVKLYFDKGLINSSEDIFKQINGKEINIKYDKELLNLENQEKKENKQSIESQLEDLKNQIDNTKIPKELRELRKKYNELIKQLPKGTDTFRISDANNIPLDQSEIDEIREMLPKFIELSDMSEILDNLRTNGIPLGVFKDEVIYLNENSTQGTAYHEAFHAVFRTVLSDSDINKYLLEAKKEYNSRNSSSKLRKDIDKLRNYNSDYNNLSNNELESLVYEEYMADKFMEFKKDSNIKNPFRRLFIIIKQLLKLFKYNSEELEALFDKISSKAFYDSEIKDNKFTRIKVGLPVFKLIPAGQEVRINEETGEKESYFINHTQQKSEKMISTIAAKINKAENGEYNEDLQDKSREELFDYFINQRVTELTEDFDVYYNIISKSNPKLASKVLDLAMRELDTYTNDDSLKVLSDAVEKRLSIFEYDKLEEENSDSDSNDQGQTEEVAEKFGSQDSWLSGGHESLPKLIKQYISFSTYSEFDNLIGKDVEVAVDAVIAYNGLTRILADTPRNNMISKLYSVSKYNPNIKAVLERLMSDTGMVVNEDGTISQPSKNFNDYQMFLNTFDNSLTKQVFTLVKEDGTYQVGNANTNDAKVLTTSYWANNIQYILEYGHITNSELADRYSEVEDKFNSGITKPVTSKQLESKVLELEEAFRITGIKLSKGFIEYSLLSAKKEKGVKLTKLQEKVIELNSDVKPLDIKLFTGLDGFKGLAGLIADKENLFSKEEGKGAYTRLEELAEANGMFDETIGNASFKNAEGKSVYEIIKSSYVLSEAKKLGNEDYLKQLESGKDKNNDLNNRNYKFISKNYLLNNFRGFVKNLNINIIDGLRKEDRKGNSEGTVFGDYDGRTYLVQGLAFFANRNKKGLVKYIFRQNEASNTAYTAELPVQQLTDDGKPNIVILDALYNSFLNEFERIGRETKLFGSKNNIIYKKYNDSVKGRAFDFTEFQYIKDLNSNLYNELLTLAKENKLSEIPEKEVKQVISDYLIEGIKRYKENLQNYGIVKLDENGSVTYNQYMPASLADGENSRYSNRDEALAEFYLNDYLMSNSLNELMDGDYAISRKDKVDISKRNKGAMGSGNNYGTGTHRVAYIKDILSFVNKTPIDGNLIRVPEAGENTAEINSNDAQSYQSLNHKIYAMSTLGRLDNKTWNIYKKIIKGEKIKNSEQAHLEANKASLNPDKTVTFGMGIYHKTSEHTLVRSMISYIPKNNKKEFEELTDRLISLLEKRDFDKSKLTSLTSKLAKLYEPIPGFEYHHRLANQMDIHGIDQVITESASKGATLIPINSLDINMDLSLSMTDVLNEYKRLQVETPTGKEQITDGSQLMQLIDSEQKDNEEFTFPDGSKKTLGEIRLEYRKLMSSSRSNSFKAATTYLKATSEGKIDKTKLDQKLFRSLEASGSDDVILELFGKPYNFNMSNMVDKAEQIVLAHFSKGVLAQKVNGTKVSLVSGAGIEVLRNEDNSVVPLQDILKDPVKYKNWTNRSKLQHNKKDKDGVYSECLLSERVLTKHGLKVGDNIPSELLKALGYRIPTQDKHSMMAFRIVGLMPNYMEGAGIFPDEIVYLSGADFDIDSEFIQTYDYWLKDDKAIKYGTETSLDDKWESFIYYKTNVDKEFKRSYKTNLKNVKDENRALELTLSEFGLPLSKQEFTALKEPEMLNNGVINNLILDNRIALLTNNEMLKEIAYTPSSTKSLADVAESIQELKDNNSKYIVNNRNISASDINGKFEANTKNSAGKSGIGVVANKLQVFAFLAKVNTKLSEEAFKYQIAGYIGNGYSFLTSSGNRIADTLSTILSVMTDNAKDPIAGKLNLSLELLPGFSELISQGLPEYEAGLLINQPIIQLYGQLKQTRKFAIKSAVEQGFSKEKTVAAAIAAYRLREEGGLSSPNFSKVYKSALTDGYKDLKDQVTNLSKEDMENIISGKISDDLTLETLQLNALMQFIQIESQSDILSNINTLLKLNQGLNTSFNELEANLIKALEELGIAPQFGIREQLVDEPSIIVDIKPALAVDPLTVGNINRALRVLKIGEKLFISQTNTFKKSFNQLKDILNKSYANKKDTVREVGRSLLGYISTRGYLNLLKKTVSNPNSSQRVKDLYTKRLANINNTLIYRDLGGKTLTQQLIELKNSDNEIISNNALIRYLQAETNEELDLVTSKTFAKESKETISILLDSFKDLYNNPETKDFAINMFNYLIVKDNLEFRNNTFIKFVAPFMFDKLSQSLDITLEELSKENGNTEKVLGDTIDNISYNFRKLYSTYIGNRFGKLKYKQLEGESGFTKTDDTIIFDVFKNIQSDERDAYIREQKNLSYEQTGVRIENESIDYSFDKFPDLKNLTRANREYIDTIFENKIINGKKLFIFPQFAIFNDSIYELTAFNDVNGVKYHPKSESRHEGSSAIYTKLEEIGNKKTSPFSNENYDQALQTKKELGNKDVISNPNNDIEEDYLLEDDFEAQVANLENTISGQESIDFDEDKPKSFESKKPQPILYKENRIENILKNSGYITQTHGDLFIKKDFYSEGRNFINSLTPDLKSQVRVVPVANKTGASGQKIYKVLIKSEQKPFNINEEEYNRIKNTILDYGFNESTTNSLIKQLDESTSDEEIGALLKKLCNL